MKLKDIIIINKMLGKKVVHVEAPYLFKKPLIKHLEKYHSKCYCICPCNYPFVKSNYGMKKTLKEFNNYLKEFYLLLKSKGIDLQLHVHLSMFPKALSYDYKKKLIEDAYKFFKKDLGIIPKEIVFGWWAYDKESKRIAENLGLKIIEKELHVYDSWMK